MRRCSRSGGLGTTTTYWASKGAPQTRRSSVHVGLPGMAPCACSCSSFSVNGLLGCASAVSLECAMHSVSMLVPERLLFLHGLRRPQAGPQAAPGQVHRCWLGRGLQACAPSHPYPSATHAEPSDASEVTLMPIACITAPCCCHIADLHWVDCSAKLACVAACVRGC